MFVSMKLTLATDQWSVSNYTEVWIQTLKQ